MGLDYLIGLGVAIFLLGYLVFFIIDFPNSK